MALLLEEDDIDVDSSYRTVFAPRFLSRLRQIKVPPPVAATGNQVPQYLLGTPILSDSRLRESIGEFTKFNQIPTTNLPGASIGAPTTSGNGNYSDVLHGNLGEIIVGRWGGLEVENDRGLTNFKTDHVLLKVRMYMDTNVRQARALILSTDVKVR